MSRNYELVTRVLSDNPGKRKPAGIAQVDGWFRQKSALLKKLCKETLLDVIQHCEFVTCHKDDLVIQQGEKGHRFYIILRGAVTVMHKDSLEDVDMGEEKEKTFRQVDRTTLGASLVSLGEGQAFGEIALINPDCIRTASIVADERTDLVVIHRDLYNRSVSKVITKEWNEKVEFIDAMPHFAGWAQKLKRHLAMSFRKEVMNFDSVMVKQGDQAKDLYFIVKGEVKLMVDPEAHYHQFQRFLNKCEDLLEQEGEPDNDTAYFPHKLLPQLQRYTRVNKAALQMSSLSVNNGVAQHSGVTLPGLPKSFSPSSIRKMNHNIASKRVNISLCYLGEKQVIGDLEILLGLDAYHCTAVCSQETVVMVLHKPHFERLFKKRSPSTVKNMCNNLKMQLTMRIVKPHILESAPLLRCLLFKLLELIGEKRAGQEKEFLSTIRSIAHGESTPSDLHQPIAKYAKPVVT